MATDNSYSRKGHGEFAKIAGKKQTPKSLGVLRSKLGDLAVKSFIPDGIIDKQAVST
jgi:hypothetical protein